MREYFSVILLLFLFSCSNSQEHSVAKTDKEFQVKTPETGLFVLENVKNIEFVSDLDWAFDTLYWKKSGGGYFRKLSNVEKVKFLSKFIGAEKEWLEMDLNAYIVAKQSKIGAFEPTLIKIYGTDYAGLVLVNLDDKENVVSGFPIYSLEISGYATEEDTLIVTRPKVKCIFTGNKLEISEETGRCKSVNSKIQTFTVSESRFNVVINEDGKISKTTPINSQYSKKCKLDYFQSY